MSEEKWAKFFELMEMAEAEGRDAVKEAVAAQNRESVLTSFLEEMEGYDPHEDFEDEE